MKSAPVVPARIDFTDGVPVAPDFGDVYHARASAFGQARHVFLGGNRLPARWQGRERFVVLETGFGLGNNFLATWEAWRSDPRRCERLWFIAVEKHPPRRDDLARAHAASPVPALASALVDAWPPLTFNLHTLPFDDGRVTLMLAFGDAAGWLRELVATVDAFFLDGFAPARNPDAWSGPVFAALGRLAAPGASAATWSSARTVRNGLAQAGFVVERADGFDRKRDMTVATYAPRFRPPRPPGRPDAAGARDVFIVGAGLAGASAAQALAAQGIACRVLDALPAPAQAASGNAAGLFHGTVHAEDGPHARFNRAAALRAADAYRALLRAGRAAGRADGLLRLETSLTMAAMQQRLDTLALPPDWVRALDATGAGVASGWPLDVPAWFYPSGGWIDPSSVVKESLSAPGVTLSTGMAVQALRRNGHRWQALDRHGAVLAEADVAVVAAAHDAARLCERADWPLSPVRGQVTRIAPGTVAPPHRPVAGAGYAIPLPDGGLLCGATAQPGDAEPGLRPADQRDNLDRLARLLGQPLPDLPLDGRVGWRCHAPDRMPLVGAVPAAFPVHPPWTQARHVPREPGLFVLSALGSRGLTWAPLCGHLLAAAVTGSPWPLEAGLADAIDPARFAVRRVRTSAS